MRNWDTILESHGRLKKEYNEKVLRYVVLVSYEQFEFFVELGGKATLG